MMTHADTLQVLYIFPIFKSCACIYIYTQLEKYCAHYTELKN